jgi:hypothetical protein
MINANLGITAVVLAATASFVSTEKRLKVNAAIDPLALARPISSFISKLKKFVRSVVDKAACQHISSRSVKQRFLTPPTGTSRKAHASSLKDCQNVTASLSIE